MTDQKRRLQRIALSRPCLIWTGATNNRGYGVRTIGGYFMLAHRSEFIIAVGDPGPEVEIDHLCNVPTCYEITHLEAVSCSENNRRKWERRPACRRGHPRNEKNTYTKTSGERVCWPCQRMDVARRSRERRARCRAQ